MWQKTLCAERVFLRPFMGAKARVGANLNFVKKGYALFDKLKQAPQKICGACC